jgi:hypothetical protein
LLIGVGALAQDADDSRHPEAWIPLEDLPPDDQEAALDAEEVDRDKRSAAPTFSAATDQLVAHALYQVAIAETGVDLLGGTP